jgi:hypothetical protein
MKYFLLPALIGLCGLQVLQAQDKMANTGVIKMHAGSAMGIFGDFQNDGTFAQTAGAVTFSGSAAQLVSGAVAPSFYDLAIKNTGTTGVTLGNGLVTVSNSLVFTDGYFYTTSTNLLEVLDNATTSGASTASFVEGPIRKIGNDAFIFPVGKLANYQPVAITVPGVVTDAYTAEYMRANPTITFGGTPGTGVDHVSTCEYWTVNRTAGTSNVGVTLGWNSNSCGVTVLPDLRVVRWNGSSWTDLGNGGTTGNTTAGTVVTALPATQFGPFTLGSSSLQNPLPIGLLDFQATAVTDHVDLDWQTASESDNAYFTVEKTRDGNSYEWVATVTGADVSTQVLHYTAVDKKPYAGVSYYRLTQTDFDGAKKYSDLRSVKFAQETTAKELAFDIYPNPNEGDWIRLRLGTGFSQQSQVEITDFTGKRNHAELIAVGKSGEIYVIDPAQPLQPGVYTVTVTSADQKLSQRFTVY